MGKQIKARYWQAVGYPENFVDDWKDIISEKFQVPYAYCIHDKDLDKEGNHRKDHVHLIIAFSNTTTESAALTVFKSIQKEGCSAYPNDKIEQCFNVRHAYDYLIHDTEDSRKKKKYQYDKKERITGNNFDIGDYEQISIAEKKRIRAELARLVLEKNYTNFADFYADVVSNYTDDYSDVVETSSAFFERLTKGNYQKIYNRLK